MHVARWLRAATIAAAVGAALGGNGCSSSSTGASPPSGDSGAVVQDAGFDGAVDAPVDTGPEAAAVVDSSAGGDAGEAGAKYDGTTGKPCTSDADCHAGAGVNQCSSDGVEGTDAVYPTPVCLDPLPCNLPDDGKLHFCDGPDEESSPGVCIAAGMAQGEGLCLPKCTFHVNGDAPTGCAGKDVCIYDGWYVSSMTGLLGVGVCLGGCTADADCPDGQKCQVFDGFCVSSLAASAALGTACTSSANCYCIEGYCSQLCTVGGIACPSDWVCDTTEPLTVDNAGQMITAFTELNAGLGGTCAVACSLDGGTGAGDGGACPHGSTCQLATPAGPDCLE